MKKDIHVQFSQNANEAYQELQQIILEEQSQKKANTSHTQLLNAIVRTITNLEEDPQLRIHIPRKNIPKQAIKKYGTDRLWKINLTGYWRMIYTLIGDEIKLVVLVLEIINHKKYDKIFEYKKK